MEPMQAGFCKSNESQYICNNLGGRGPYAVLFSKQEGELAADFLRELWMAGGFGVFSYARQPGEGVVGGNDGWRISEIEARVCWLHFAADLAEEWGL